MAIISADTFRPLKRHIGCRLQQGVPIVDADWNELEDIRRFELRAFLKWFIGDGIPEGTDGFRMVGQNQPNDFLISAGTPPAVLSTDPVEHALRDIGRLLVDGRDILLDADLRYRQQPLHVSQPGAAALAAALGVPTVPELPSLNGEVLVYVDIWDRVLTPAEDPSLLFPGLGTESCARLKREWVVRARVSATAPRLTAPADPDYLAGHSYYALARVLRRTTSPNVVSTDVVDLRARRLFLPSATLIEDVLGTTADRYRQGQDRPAINLRAAINALLRGELPGTPDAAISPTATPFIMMRAFTFDRSNGLLAAWQSTGVGSNYQVFINRLSLGNIPGGFDPVPVQVTATTNHPYPPSIAVLPNGEVLVAYTEVDANFSDSNALYKRAPYSALATAPELPVANTPQFEAAPMVLVSGNVAVFIFALLTGGTSQWCFRRLRHTDNTWLDANPVVLAPQEVTSFLHAAVAEDGRIWVLSPTRNDKVYVLSLDPVTGVVSNNSMFDADIPDPQTFILPTKAGPVFAFWLTSSGVVMTRFAAGVWDSVQVLPFTVHEDLNPTAVEDAYGGLWLYFSRGSPSRLYYVRREPADGRWGLVRQLTVPPNGNSNDSIPFSLQAPDRSTWIFWQSDRNGGGNQNIFYKQVFNSI
ncbi:hypothetical protein [Pyxidicoccus caerfyrddinensis]|uniref:hypothetical protein n=1 Tax=Pyxidicoccus caerfyrddinensis TaxID=2709663 RepID=UPI0013D9A030|nr:hypothetical protein [Pyxidicoccus caerfyrddinensis]